MKQYSVNQCSITDEFTTDRVRSYLKFTLTVDGRSAVLTGDYAKWSVDANAERSGFDRQETDATNAWLERHGYPRLEEILVAGGYDFWDFVGLRHLAPPAA